MKLSANLIAVAMIASVTVLIIAGMYFYHFAPIRAVVESGEDIAPLMRANHYSQIVIALMAVLGFLVGTIGLFLLYGTLKSTQAAAKSAAETLRVAQEALSEERRRTGLEFKSELIAQSVFIHEMYDQDGTIWFELDIMLKNAGRSDCQLVEMEITMKAEADYTTGPDPEFYHPAYSKGKFEYLQQVAEGDEKKLRHIGFVIPPGPDNEVDYEKTTRFLIRPEITLYYRDQFTDPNKLRKSHFECVDVTTTNIDHNTIDISKSFPLEHIKTEVVSVENPNPHASYPRQSHPRRRDRSRSSQSVRGGRSGL